MSVTSGSRQRLGPTIPLSVPEPPPKFNESRVACAVLCSHNLLNGRAFAERSNNIVHWSQMDRGGHFAASDAPDLLVGDLRTFFRRFR